MIVGVKWAERDNEVNRHVLHIMLIGVNIDLGVFAGVWDGLVECEYFDDELGTDIAVEGNLFVILVNLGLLRGGDVWIKVFVNISG